jgi:hypothetical protein
MGDAGFLLVVFLMAVAVMLAVLMWGRALGAPAVERLESEGAPLPPGPEQ